MTRTAIQLGTLRALRRDPGETLPETIARVGSTALEGVAFSGLGGASPAAVADALDEAGLKPVSAEVSIDHLASEYETVVETYATIGCPRLSASVGADTLPSPRDVEALAARVRSLSGRLADDGIDLLYRNGRREFERPSDSGPDGTLVAALGEDVELELDTGLARYGGPTRRRSSRTTRTGPRWSG